MKLLTSLWDLLLEVLTDLNNSSSLDQKQEKFMELYSPLHERLNRYIQSMVWNLEDAKDILSQTILTAFENFGKVRDQEAFLFYLFGTASHIIKKKERRKKFWGVFEQEKAELLGSHESSESRVTIKELYAAMNKLSAKQRQAISLFELSGFSIKEIAALQRTSESGVKSSLLRGREKLAKLLGDEVKEKRIVEAVKISTTQKSIV